MTYLSQLKSKNIVVLGAGLTGLSCARFLQKHAIDFSINDNRDNALSPEQIASLGSNVNLSFGQWDKNLLANAEVILVSPGIDLAQHNLAALFNPNAQIFGDVELYCRLTSTPVIAVTGSNGKSTVVSLLAHIGQALGKNVQLGGNVGVPVLDQLSASVSQAQDNALSRSELSSSELSRSELNTAELNTSELNTSELNRAELNTAELLILELSSFQLETLTSMNAIAASILNISDDHLDRHKTLECYTEIKQRIYPQSRVTVINRDDVATHYAKLSQNQQQVSFGSDEPQEGNFGMITVQGELHLAYGNRCLIALSRLPLAGLHNGLNYLAALALGMAAGWELDAMLAACQSFKGLAHRCEKLITNDGVTWINDSKATNVGATLAAINGIAPTVSSQNKLILIAGGDGKGADFSVLSPALNAHVSDVLTLGKDGQQIAELAAKGTHFSTLADTVFAAKKLAVKGDVVLLSPACASIDMFKNFVARGEAFAELVFVELVKGESNV